MDIIAFILAHKVTILFIIASTGFCFSTIWLGVENANLKTDLSRREITPTPLTPLTDEATTSPLSTTPSPIDMAKYRLPSTVKPLHYDLYFYPSLSTGLFHGVVTIDVEILKSTTEIVLHSQDLTISEATIDGIKGEFETDEKFELLTIRRNDKKAFTPKSNHKVLISFNGDMKKGIVGLYRSSYYNNDGELKYIATSKFEPTYARQAYPCFDEPNLKATYKVHLLRPNDLRYIALSNYPEESEMPITDGIMVHFEKSKPMSTNKDKETKFRVYTTPGQLSKADYAIKVGVEIMEFYVKYFDIEYPLPKLDMIAIPDFVSGAMEHWGLVTFRETSLLYSADQHSSANKQRVAEVVAHELAHSWFGNLVTMNWWNNLWLNEGFATYIEYKGVDSVHSDWKMMDQFIVDSLHSILALDATEASHPIIQKVETPDQITEVFDAISYNKGAAILRMLEYAIGEKAFKNGVTNYLRKHAFKNAVNMDLWKEIQDIVGRDKLDVYTFMDTYTMQIGYPVIDVEFQGNNCILRQKRFVLDKDATKDSAPAVFQYKWTIPISYITNYGESEIYWFNYTEDQLILDLPPGFQYIKFNPRQVGYYRVNYHDDVWRNIINFIVQLSPADKAHVLDEVFSLAQAGELSYHVALDATTYLITESNYVPWAAAAPKLVTVAAYFKNTPIETELQNYVIHLLWPMYEKITWDDSNENELHLVKRLRVTILSLACSFGAEPALEEARKRLLEWHGDKDKVIAPNLRAIVYKYGMMDLSTKEWHTMFDRFADEQDANEKLKLLNGLANVNNPALLTQLINLGKNERYIRSQDYFTMLQYISNNPAGTGLVWDYVREHWDELVARFTLNDRYLGRLIPAITSSFTTKVKLGEMERFFSDNPDAGAGASARLQALERVKNNILWLEKYKTDVELWFDKRKKRDI